MRAVVTGGAGFIGSAIARRLLADGSEVTILDSLMEGSEDRAPEGTRLIRGDVRDLEAVRPALEGAEIVFHEAAVTSVARSIDDPVLTTTSNVLGTLNVLQAAHEAGARRVVYASSSSIYGDVEGINSEDLAPDPRSPYAASKLAGEHLCRVWTRVHGLSTVSLRYFNVFGPGQHPGSKYAAVFPAFTSALTKGKAPELHWDGEQVRDFTFIDDVVDANIKAGESGSDADGGVFNIGGGRPKSINEVLQAVSRAVGRWVEPVSLPQRPGDIRRSHADISRARETLKWEPQAEWEDAIARTVRWFEGRVP